LFNENIIGNIIEKYDIDNEVIFEMLLYSPSIYKIIQKIKITLEYTWNDDILLEYMMNDDETDNKLFNLSKEISIDFFRNTRLIYNIGYLSYLLDNDPLFLENFSDIYDNLYDVDSVYIKAKMISISFIYEKMNEEIIWRDMGTISKILLTYIDSISPLITKDYINMLYCKYLIPLKLTSVISKITSNKKLHDLLDEEIIDSNIEPLL